MASMRRVTAKPPNMLMAVSTSATTAQIRISVLGRSAAPAAVSGGATCTSAPMAMMELMALVTLISGVCSEGVTFHTTM